MTKYTIKDLRQEAGTLLHDWPTGRDIDAIKLRCLRGEITVGKHALTNQEIAGAYSTGFLGAGLLVLVLVMFLRAAEIIIPVIYWVLGLLIAAVTTFIIVRNCMANNNTTEQAVATRFAELAQTSEYQQFVTLRRKYHDALTYAELPPQEEKHYQHVLVLLWIGANWRVGAMHDPRLYLSEIRSTAAESIEVLKLADEAKQELNTYLDGIDHGAEEETSHHVVV